MPDRGIGPGRPYVMRVSNDRLTRLEAGVTSVFEG